MDRITDQEAPRASKPSNFLTSAKSKDLEATVCSIRGSDSWIQHIVDKLKDANGRRLSSPTSHHASVEGQASQSPVSQVCIVSRHTPEENSDTSLLHKRRRSTAQMSHVDQCEGRVHLYSAELELLSHDAGTMDGHGPIKLLHVVAFGLVHIAAAAFVVALRLTLIEKQGSLLVWHPVLMGAVLVVLTEATVITQNMPWVVSHSTRQMGRKAYTIAQWLAAAVCTTSLVVCIKGYSEIISVHGLGPAHRRVGFAAMLVLSLQLTLDVGATCCAGKQSVLLQPKHRRHVSRALGYLALVLMWASAWLGVHSRWLSHSDTSQQQVLVSEWTWFSIFAALIVGIVVLVDMSKFGFN